MDVQVEFGQLRYGLTRFLTHLSNFLLVELLYKQVLVGEVALLFGHFCFHLPFFFL